MGLLLIGYVGFADYRIDPVTGSQQFQPQSEVLSESTTQALAKPEAKTDPKTQPKNQPLAQAPAPASQPAVGSVEKYSQHTVTASIYGIGEGADESNNFISNVPSAWSSNAVGEFGGVDNMEGQRSFTPKHNSFYYALPATEFNDSGLVPGAREKSPWASEIKNLRSNTSLFKGRWVRVSRTVNGQVKTIYAQWQDVGPNEEQDYGYVFGNGSQKPKNTFGVHAGIDLSPDIAKELGFTVAQGSASVTWSFVDSANVPNGLWKKYPAIDNKIRW